MVSRRCKPLNRRRSPQFCIRTNKEQKSRPKIRGRANRTPARSIAIWLARLRCGRQFVPTELHVTVTVGREPQRNYRNPRDTQNVLAALVYFP